MSTTVARVSEKVAEDDIPFEDLKFAPSPYGSDRRPPFWGVLLSNLRGCPSLKYAVAMTKFRVGPHTVQLTESMLARYIQAGVEFGGIPYPPGGQEAHAELIGASGQLLTEMIAGVVEEPRLTVAIERMYPGAFPKDHDPIDNLMTRETGTQRDIPPEVAEQMMRDFLEAKGYRVVGPKDAARAVAKPREVYQPLPEPEDDEADVEVIDEVEARRGIVVKAGEG